MRTLGLRFERELRLLLTGLIYLSFLTPLIVGRNFLFPFVFPKAIFFQALVQAGLIVYALLVIADRSYLPKRNWILAGVGGYLFVMALTGFLGADPSFSFWSKAERMDGLMQYLHLGAFLLFLLAAMRHEAEWLRLFRYVILTGWLIGIVALFAKYAPAVISLGAQDRLGATFGNPAFLSTYFLVCTFLAMIFFLRGRGAFERWMFGGSALFFFFLMLFSGTRGAYAGFLAGVAGFLFFLVIWDRTRWLKPVAIIAILLLFFAADLFIMRNTFLEYFPQLGDRVFSMWQFPKARLVSWDIGLAAFRARPLLGWGQENFIYAFNIHFDPNIHTYELSLFDRAHNKIIDLLVMNGLLGLAAYLVLLAAVCKELFFILRKKLVNPIWPAGFFGLMTGYVVQNMVLFEMPTSGIIFFFLLGFLIWLSNEVRREMKKPEKNTVVSPTAQRPLSDGAGFVLFTAALIAVIASFYFGIAKPFRAAQGVVAAASGFGVQNEQIPRALEAYRYARDNSTFLDREVDVLVARRFRDFVGGYPAALSQEAGQEFGNLLLLRLQEDFDRHKLDYDVLIEAGNIAALLEQHNPQRASNPASYWEKAMRIAPKRQDAYQQLAIWHMNKGEYAKAEEMIQKVLSLNDQVGIFWWYKAVLEARQGNVGAMHEALERAKNVPHTWYHWDQNPGAIAFLAEEFRRQNNKAEVIRLYEIMLRIPNLAWQDKARALANLVSLFTETGRKEQAAEAARRLREHAPELEQNRVEEFLKPFGI